MPIIINAPRGSFFKTYSFLLCNVLLRRQLCLFVIITRLKKKIYYSTTKWKLGNILKENWPKGQCINYVKKSQGKGFPYVYDTTWAYLVNLLSKEGQKSLKSCQRSLWIATKGKYLLKFGKYTNLKISKIMENFHNLVQSEQIILNKALKIRKIMMCYFLMMFKFKPIFPKC